MFKVNQQEVNFSEIMRKKIMQSNFIDKIFNWNSNLKIWNISVKTNSFYFPYFINLVNSDFSIKEKPTINNFIKKYKKNIKWLEKIIKVKKFRKENIYYDNKYE